MNKSNYGYIAIAIIVGLTAVATFVLMLQRFGDKEYGPNLIMGFACALVSALLTLYLLNRQTRTEQEKERTVKIFELKLNIYQDFLNTLNEVLNDGTISPEEALKLKFKISQIAMHSKNESIKAISDSIKKIFDKVNEQRDFRSEDVDLEELLKIVDQFRSEIYDKEKVNLFKNEKVLDEAIENFKEIDYRLKEPPKSVDKIETGKTIDTSKAVTTIDDLAARVKGFGWERHENEVYAIEFKKSKVKVRAGQEGNWHFSVHVELPYNEREVYHNLRRSFGGGFNSGSSWGWYLNFDDKYAELADNDFQKNLEENQEFNQYVFAHLLKLIAFMDNISILIENVGVKLNKLDEKKWLRELYLFELHKGYYLVNQYKKAYNDIAENYPFIDLRLKSGELFVDLSLRKGEQYLKSFLSEIGIMDNRENEIQG